MRKIEVAMCNAFRTKNLGWHQKNTMINSRGAIELFGNEIIWFDPDYFSEDHKYHNFVNCGDKAQYVLTCAGWASNTTKSRLNAFLHHINSPGYFHTEKGELFFTVTDGETRNRNSITSSTEIFLDASGELLYIY